MKGNRRGQDVWTLEGTGSPGSDGEIWISKFYTTFDELNGGISSDRC